jgi:hypothetical protein
MEGGSDRSEGLPGGRARETCPTCRRPHVSRDVRFDEALEGDVNALHVSQVDGKILIRGKPFSVSDILASDPDAYDEAVDEWRTDCRAEFRETVIARFPYPIAHHFFLYDQGYDSENSRLQHLKDTWEATISVLFAMLLGEARAADLEEIAAVGIKREYLRSQTVRERIAVIEALRHYAFDILATARMIEPRSVELMVELNRLRNEEFLHLGALNEAQSRALGERAEALLTELLESLEGLQDVRFLRLDKPQSGGRHRAECFAGHSPVHRYETLRFSEEMRKAIAARENAAAEIWTLQGDLLYSLSPYLLFRTRATGRKTDLAYFKKSSGEAAARVFTYEVIGESEEFELADAHLLADLDDIKRRFAPVGVLER